MACDNCSDTGWKPERDTLTALYARAIGPDHAGRDMHEHMEYLHEIARGENVVELGVGMADQSTIAFLSGSPMSLTCFDINRPPMIDYLATLASREGIPFTFHQGLMNECKPAIAATLLFVDGFHDAENVYADLMRYVGQFVHTIVLHDTVSFGLRGQDHAEGHGVLLGIADFMDARPEWRIERKADYCHGLITLKR